MKTSPLAALGIGAIAALLAGCSGSGGSSPATGAPNFSNVVLTVPGSSTMNVDTTYSVWETSSSGTPTVGLAPLGASAPSNDQKPRASVEYCRPTRTESHPCRSLRPST